MVIDPSLSRATAGRMALRVGADEVAHGALMALALSHAGALRSQGVRSGERVALWATPSIDTAAMLVGNLLSGIVTVPLNPSMGETELAHVLRDSEPRCILGERSGTATVSLCASASAGAGGHHPEMPSAGSPALVLYTSGTTGAPKGAVLSLANLAFDLDALFDAWAWSADDVLVHGLPWFHVHGLVLGVLGPLRRGGSVVVHPRFDPGSVAREFDRGATMFFGVPTMYHRLADHVEGDPSAARSLARARVLVSGSAPLSLREHQRIERATGRGVIERYGLTETLINTSVRVAEGPRPGTVGRALAGVELRLVGDGEVSEVSVRGPNVFEGYLGRPDATRAVRDEAGWFSTGDLATMDPDGALRIVGRRATDLIKTGGYKVGAGEVEGCLLEHPAVREAAVKGVTDDDLGERIEAWVTLVREGAVRGEELAEWVASRLARYKRPRAVHLVAELPRNAMGKVLKSRLGSP